MSTLPVLCVPGTTQRQLRQGLHEEVRTAFHLDTGSGIAVGVHEFAWTDRRTGKQIAHIVTEVFDFSVLKHVLEDIEPVLPIRIDDVAVYVAAFIESHGTSVADATGPRHSFTGVRFHTPRIILRSQDLGRASLLRAHASGRPPKRTRRT